ncbi:hypothetical protein DEJ36_01330 [Curtobacterium sp. MCPF17_052]|nr:hypothetical protein [Curtobacterium sp. MCPF17_052]WIB12761.1 hypothetical protein DEJ36_01330 [Curtobacterium sp. MCPF17_052]
MPTTPEVQRHTAGVPYPRAAANTRIAPRDDQVDPEQQRDEHERRSWPDDGDDAGGHRDDRGDDDERAERADGTRVHGAPP